MHLVALPFPDILKHKIGLFNSSPADPTAASCSDISRPGPGMEMKDG